MNKNKIFLVILCFIVLALKLYFSFQVPNLSYDSYFAVRQVDHIKETGLVFFEDELSYGGRFLIFSPLFYYVLAFFSLFLPTIFAIKLLSSVFAVLLIPIVYLIAKEVSKKESAALLSALFAGFIPVFFYRTLNSASVYSLVIPLMFALIYSFIKINEGKQYIYIFVALLFVLTLTSPAIFLFVLTLFLFLFLAKLESLKITKSELESSLLAIFLVFWLLFLTFKKAFLIYGFDFIWSNIPNQILQVYFPRMTILTAVYEIGVIPFITGIFIVYSHLFVRKEKKNYLLISFALVTFLMLWLRMMRADTSLIFLGAVFAILFAVFYQRFFSVGFVLPIIFGLFYKKGFRKMRKIKRSRTIKAIAYSSLIILIIVSSILPSLTHASKIEELSPSQKEIEALEWIKNNTNETVTVAAILEEGYLINAVAERKNIADLNFILADDAEQRFNDIERIFNTPYQTVAIDLLEKYDAKYIFLSQRAMAKYSLDDLRYVDEKCFELVYDKGVKIYKSLCRLT